MNKTHNSFGTSISLGFPQTLPECHFWGLFGSCLLSGQKYCSFLDTCLLPLCFPLFVSPLPRYFKTVVKKNFLLIPKLLGQTSVSDPEPSFQTLQFSSARSSSVSISWLSQLQLQVNSQVFRADYSWSGLFGLLVSPSLWVGTH